MALWKICGRAGSGKTTWLCRRIGQAMQQGQPSYLIVPDQYTLQGERELMRHLHAEGLWHAEVLSISRLCERVLAQKPSLLKPMDRRGEAMAVSRMLLTLQDELTVYGRYAHSPQFAATLAGEIAEYKRFGIAPEALMEAGQARPHLQEIAKVYAAYQGHLAGEYQDTEDKTDLCIDLIPQTVFLKGALVCIDGFEMLTKQVYRLVEALLRQCADVCISFRLGLETDADAPTFATEHKHLARVSALAERCGIRQHTVWLPREKGQRPPRFAHSPALAYLESHLFAYRPAPYEGPAQEISLIHAGNPWQEAEDCARQIFALVKDHGLRYNEIAVVSSEIELYGPLLQRALSLYDIPMFWDIKRRVSTHPAAQFVLQALRVVQNRRFTRDVVRFLKSGFTRLSQEQCEQMQRWARRFGLRAYPPTPPSAMEPEEQEAYLSLYHLLFDPLEALRKSLLKARSAKQQAEALVQYLEEDGFIERLQATIDETYLDDPDTAAQASEFFTLLGDLLAQVIRVLGDQVLSPGDFATLLSSGLAAEEIGLLPSQNDAINAGSILRSKMDEIKALFVLGLSAGKVPAGTAETGLLSRSDHALLEENGLWMGNNEAERASEEELAVYSVFCKPSHWLYLFYPQADLAGKQLLPSPYIEQISQLFPGAVRRAAQRPQEVSSPKATLLPLAEAVRRVQDGETVDPVWAAAYCALEQMHYPQVAQALKGLSPREDEIGPALAHALYADEKGAYTTPITGLETLARCPFRHFMERGLHLAPADEFGKTPIDEGNYYHAVLQHFLLLYRDRTLTREQCRSAVDKLCQAYEAREYLSGPYAQDARASLQAEKQRDSLYKAAWMLCRQKQSGQFVPQDTEVPCRIRVPLTNGAEGIANGVIDRIDLKREGGTSYVRVVDYKSGSVSQADLTRFACGTSLQLPLYLQMAAQKKQAAPSAMALSAVRASVQEDDPQHAEEDLSAQKLKGYYTAHGVEDRALSTQSAARLLTDEQMAQVLSDSLAVTASLFETLSQGHTAPYPLKGAVDGCQYCAFANACGYLSGVTPHRTVRKVSLSKEEDSHDPNA